MTVLVHGETPQLSARLVTAGARYLQGETFNILHTGDLPPETLNLYGGAGASTVYRISQKLSAAGPAMIATTIAMTARETNSTAILLSSTKYGREIGPRVAEILQGSYSTECTQLEKTDSGIVVRRLVLGGAYQAKLLMAREPYVIGLQAIADVAGGAGQAPRVVELSAKVEAPRIELVEVQRPEASHVDLERADFIVGVGRGFKKKEDLALAEELAKVLGAEIGCSRPISGDLKWMSEDRHIGLSGKRVRPRTYLALGISGQVQHLVGIRDAKLIISVNIDPNAPIMSESDYAVVGDLYKIVPLLTEKLRERLGRR
jgi:electron transfer flavoprotein alpha subunit